MSKTSAPDIILVPPIINPFREKFRNNFIPVGLLVLLASLARNSLKGVCYQPRSIITDRSGYKKVAEDILCSGAAVVGFSTWCSSYPASLLIAAQLKEIDCHIPVIFGGPQASALAFETLVKYPQVDFVLAGESENSLPVLVCAILDGNVPGKAGSIPGFSFRDATVPGGVTTIPPDCADVDLDRQPIPLYEQILHRDNLRIDAGRGCPFRCTYCSTSIYFNQRHSTKTPSRIVEEMEYCREKLDAVEFSFAHDMLTLRKGFIRELCMKIRDYSSSVGKAVSWSCSARTDCVSSRMLKDMYSAGCRAVFFGLESGSEKIQEAIRKNLCVEEAHHIIGHSVSTGISTTVSYMAGFPGETGTELQKTLHSAFYTTYLGARVQMTLLSVLPGTSLYEQYAGQLEYDGIHSGFSEALLDRTAERMVKSDREVFSSFYYLPNNHLPRSLMILVSDLVNLLHHFRPTIQLLMDSGWKEQVFQESLEYIRLYLQQKKNELHGTHTALDCLSGMIADRFPEELPGNRFVMLTEVFLIDFLKAQLSISFLMKQFHCHSMEPDAPQDMDFHEPDLILMVPVWQATTSTYDIPALYKTLQCRTRKKSAIGRGLYHLIVVAVSDTTSHVYGIDEKEAALLHHMTDMKVIDYFRLAGRLMSRKESEAFLMKLIRAGMVRIQRENRTSQGIKIK